MKTRKNVIIDLKAFGERISALRKTKKILQEDVAEALDYTRSNYSKIESGSVNISIDAAFKLSQLFDVSIDYLVTGQHSPKVPDFGNYTEDVQTLLNTMHQDRTFMHRIFSELYTWIDKFRTNQQESKEKAQQ